MANDKAKALLNSLLDDDVIRVAPKDRERFMEEWRQAMGLLSQPNSVSENVVREAFEDGFYEGAGGDSWHRDHTTEGELLPDASVHKPMQEFLSQLRAGTLDSLTQPSGSEPEVKTVAWPKGFDQDDMLDVADGLDCYEPKLDGQETTTAYTARFIRALLGQEKPSDKSIK